ncbi:MAG: GNAT family N-acetyltransferase [Thermoplasmata archaeon]
MIRLAPMSDADFQASRDRAIPRHAAEEVRRGFWTEEEAIQASRTDFAQLLPQGSQTPHHHFCTIIDEGSGSRVGETWYVAEAKGGKMQFWIDWIWIEPQLRQRGYATQTFHHLEQEARAVGADRIGLHVLADNDGAIALYSKLGYRTTNLRMSKLLSPPP